MDIKTWRERVQRWFVNQRNAKYVLWMLNHRTSDGDCALVQWALSYANEKSGFQQTVGHEIALWLQMPEMKLGLLFESEVGAYFEEVMAWHNRTGPINKRSGFRMLELFDLYFGFELPWWNRAVNNHAAALPDTMKYLAENFDGDKQQFRREQIERGLTKGREKLIEMSERYLLRAPIILIIMTNAQEGPSFTRALLSLLYEHMIDEGDMVGTILFDDFESPDWGTFKYDDESRPDDEAMWYNVLLCHKDDVIHWWKQIGLTNECLTLDLQRLSNATRMPHQSDSEEALLLVFKRQYPTLFECLHAVFGLMMSNSRLCEQIHSMMRQRLRKDIGMDQADAQMGYLTKDSYELREQRRKHPSSETGEPPAKKRKKARDHNKTMSQVLMIGHQLDEKLTSWLVEAKALLAEPDNGIPSITDIMVKGRRVQDKNNLKKQMDAEKKKASRLRRTKLTANDLRNEAQSLELTNDNMLKMGKERLEARARMTQLATVKFWKSIPDKTPQQLLDLARKSMPFFDSIVNNPWKNPPKKPPKKKLPKTMSKSNAEKLISQYISITKSASSHIIALLYGEGETQVKKSERLVSKEDIMFHFGLYKLEDDAWDHVEATPEASRKALESFCSINSHYTITASNDITEQEEIDPNNEVEDTNNDDDSDKDDDLRYLIA